MIITNLLTNMVVLSVFSPLTNTPAFHHYAFEAVLTNAQFVAVQWHLDPASFSTNKITVFEAKPSVRGLTGFIEFDHRYSFRYAGGRLNGFNDRTDSPSFLNPAVGKRKREGGLSGWAAATNQLSRTQALQVATAALEAIGLPPAAFQTGKPPQVTQWHFDWKDERRLAPYYSVDWLTNYVTSWGGPPWAPPARSAKARWTTNDFSLLRVNVSGISGKVTDLENHTSFLGLSKPANYLELLGLPTNTIFVTRRVPRSEPPEYELYEP